MEMAPMVRLWVGTRLQLSKGTALQNRTVDSCSSYPAEDGIDWWGWWPLSRHLQQRKAAKSMGFCPVDGV
jgi:hypothetical protein